MFGPPTLLLVLRGTYHETLTVSPVTHSTLDNIEGASNMVQNATPNSQGVLCSPLHRSPRNLAAVLGPNTDGTRSQPPDVLG